jgi:hypothetical protein
VAEHKTKRDNRACEIFARIACSCRSRPYDFTFATGAPPRKQISLVFEHAETRVFLEVEQFE